jgi:hypothetical protein
MIIQPNGKATAAEIDTFRTALAVLTAIYRDDHKAYKIACQLITDGNDYVAAIHAIANLLLQVIDASDTELSGESVLDGFRSSAAMSIPSDK